MDSTLGTGSLFNRPSPAQLLRKNSKTRSSSRSNSSESEKAINDPNTISDVPKGGADSAAVDTTTNSSNAAASLPLAHHSGPTLSTTQETTVVQAEVVIKPPRIIPRVVGTSEQNKAVQDMNDMLQIGKVRPMVGEMLSKQVT